MKGIKERKKEGRYERNYSFLNFIDFSCNVCTILMEMPLVGEPSKIFRRMEGHYEMDIRETNGADGRWIELAYHCIQWGF
jgi:hypothetical protein